MGLRVFVFVVVIFFVFVIVVIDDVLEGPSCERGRRSPRLAVLLALFVLW